MLKRLRLKNYKCYKELDIKFSDKITAIFGLSTHGKTAILNAINLISTLTPNGSSYISTFSDDKKSTINADFDNCSIEFQKTSSSAKYVLNGDEENAFTHLNKNVPDEIKNLIRIDEDNFSSQFDGPYLLFSPNSVISKKINEILGIEKWDEKLKAINSQYLSLKKEIKIKSESAKKKRLFLSNIDKYGYKDLDALVAAKDSIGTEILEKQKQIELIRQYKSMNKRKLSRISFKIAKIKKSIKEQEILNLDILTLRDTITKIRDVKIFDKSRGNFLKIEKLHTSLVEKSEKKLSVVDKINELKKIKREFDIIKEAENEVNFLKSLKDKLIKEKMEFKTCPECGQQI